MDLPLAPFPQELEHRWRGLGIETQWRSPGNPTGKGTVHLAGTDVNLESAQTDSELTDGEVALEPRFWFGGSQCHFMQVWPAENGLVAPSDHRYKIARW